MIYAIYYAIKTLVEAQLNYATIEKEHLALVYTFDKSRAYPMGAKEELYTNHYVIKYLILVKDPKPTLICWISLLSKV